MTDSLATGSPDGPRRGALVGRALRRGAGAAPLGTLVGAGLGYMSGGTETLTSGESALLMAVFVGFGMIPAAASVITIARGQAGQGAGILRSVAVAVGLAIGVGVAWMVLAAAITAIAGAVSTLQIDRSGILISSVLLGVIGGGVLGLVATTATIALRRSSGGR